MMFLPLIFLIFLHLQFVFSTSNHSSLIMGSWTYEKNGKRQNNLPNLLETLSSQSSRGLYNFSTTLSKTPNQFHGLYACRGNVDPQTCRSCVESAKNYILESFDCSREGVFWYDHCMIRYSNQSFFSKWDVNTSQRMSSWNGRKIKGSQILFLSILKHTLKSLAIKASTVQNENKYASKRVKVSRYESLYAMVQCTPDLLGKDCYSCLSHGSEKLLNMNGTVHGEVIYTSCMLEYKTTSFFTLAPPLSIKDTNSTFSNSSLISVKGTSNDGADDSSQ